MVLRFRRWWQPARKAGDPHDDRTVSFLELFYDLVYVVLVAELAHALAAHLDVKHIWQFVFLFAIVWWSWLNGTSYHEFHGNNDIRTRVFTFAQMFAVAGMAVFAHNAMGEGSVGFALFYGLFQLVVSILWWRLAVHDPEHHIRGRQFVIIFTISTVLFFVSAFVPTPFRFYIWIFAVLLTLLQPLLQFVIRGSTGRETVIENITFTHAYVERFGLFTILVLAEVIVGVVQGLTHHEHLTSNAFITGGLGLCIAFALWWLFFDFISHRPPLKSNVAGTTWMYMHLFVTMSIVAVGATVLNVVEHAGEPLDDIVRWTLVGSVAIFLLALVPLMRVITVSDVAKRAYNQGSMIMLAVAVIVALLGFTNLATLPLLIIIVVLMMIPIMYALIFWIKVLDAREVQHS